VTLGITAAVALLVIFLVYASREGDPLNRIGYGVFVSVLPALGAFVVLKLTNLFVTRGGAVIVYLALFVLVVIIQAFTRLIPVSNL
jgi:hypothetical protein